MYHSPNKEDWKIAKKYIGQLVWLISYPNIRVQFQSAWGLANLAMCESNACMGLWRIILLSRLCFASVFSQDVHDVPECKMTFDLSMDAC